jgi:flagellar basal body P-ring formation protein FlgA
VNRTFFNRPWGLLPALRALAPWLTPWLLALLGAHGMAKAQSAGPSGGTAGQKLAQMAAHKVAQTAAYPVAQEVAPSPQPTALAPGWPAGLAALAVAAAEQGARALAPAGARVQVSPLAWDSRLQLAPCAQTSAFLAAGQPAWGRTRVGLRCTDGRVNWSVFAPVQVQVWAPALVLRESLPAGARLAAGQWAERVVDWAALPAAPLTEETATAGRTLARPLAAGEALRETHLQAVLWFSSGATVQVVAAGAGFAISTDALALGHGVQGQPVRVRTEGGRVLVGRATGAARVELSL